MVSEMFDFRVFSSIKPYGQTISTENKLKFEDVQKDLLREPAKLALNIGNSKAVFNKKVTITLSGDTDPDWLTYFIQETQGKKLLVELAVFLLQFQC
jgi:hypothetical protein